MLWLLADRGVRLALAFLVGVWLARWLGPHGYGVLSWAQSTVGMVGFLATLGLEAIVIRQLVDEPDRQEDILAAAWMLRVGGGVLTVAVAAPIALIAGQDDDGLVIVTALVAATTVFQSLDVIDSWMRQHLSVAKAVIGRGCGLLLGLLARALAVNSAHPLPALGAAILVEAMLVAIGLLWAYRQAGGRLHRWRPRRARMLYLLREARPLLVAGCAVSLYARFGSVWLANQQGAATAGLFGVVTAVSEALHAIPLVIMAIHGPQMLARRHAGAQVLHADTARVLGLLTACSVGLALCLSLTARPLLTFVFGAAYGEAGSVLAIHVWSVIFVFISAGSEPWMIGSGMQNYYLAKTFVAAITSVGLNLVLVPALGASGAAWAVLGSYSVSAYWSNALFYKTRPLFALQTHALIFWYKPLVSGFGKKSPGSAPAPAVAVEGGGLQMYDGYHKYGAVEARGYDADREIEPLWAIENEYVQRYFSGRRLERLLDAPVGTGRFLGYYDNVQEVTGIDISDDMLARAGERPVVRESGRVHLQRGDIQSLAFADGYFDVVICWRLLHLIPADQLQPMLSEMRRVCRGELIVQVYRHGRWPALVARKLKRLPRTLARWLGWSTPAPTPWQHIHAYFHDRQCLEAAFEKASLEVRACNSLGGYEGHEVCVYHLQSRRLP